MDRRELLTGAAGLGAAVLLGTGGTRARAAVDDTWPGPLLASGRADLLLPEGYTAREVARGGTFPADGPVRWHRAADGAATFARDDGGWSLVSNSEVPVLGGATALHFAADGEVTGATRVLEGTSGNCAGGPTPWGTWLSCEEHERGLVWECEPFGTTADAVARPALGRFVHEAAAVDPATSEVYLTEDRGDGLLYRFSPDRAGDLSAGVLRAARVVDGAVDWLEVPAPEAGVPLRRQVPEATVFRRGEGAWFADGALWFATTADARLWRLDVAAGTLVVVHDGRQSGSPLGGPDNVTVAPDGTALVGEDGGNLEVVAIDLAGRAAPLVRFEGPDHAGSEVTGPCLSPDGTRLYVTSQRGGPDDEGVTLEVRGPFPWLAAPAPTTSASTTTSSAPPSGAVSPSSADDGGVAPVVGLAAGATAAVLGAAVALRRRGGRPGPG